MNVYSTEEFNYEDVDFKNVRSVLTAPPIRISFDYGENKYHDTRSGTPVLSTGES